MTEDDKDPWWGRVIESVAKYVTAQTFNNVLLLTIICGGAYVCIKLVPIHLTQIQQGYERLENYHREERMQTFEYLREMWGSKKLASQ